MTTLIEEKTPLSRARAEAMRSRPLPQGGESLSTVNLTRLKIYFEKGCNFLSQAPFLFLVAVSPF